MFHLIMVKSGHFCGLGYLRQGESCLGEASICNPNTCQICQVRIDRGLLTSFGFVVVDVVSFASSVAA